ncbi:MAG: lecithin retinol acyltransferase family protein [Tissierellales bacterium]|nr:lecithin retinol acyltransferase family protein [Tissierellales bacterium]MBN2826577.1 lecithin retinol acyltransferase family protein [Tissierellales bacterium]
MYGDIVFVERKPMWFSDISHLLNEHSSWIDHLILRFVLYKHYGIEIEDQQIIHFHCPSILHLDKASVEQVTVEGFLKQNGTLQYDYEINGSYDRTEIVARAKSVLKTDFGGYHVNRNNCEDFAVWCKTGDRYNRQSPFYTTYNTLSFTSKSVRKKIATVAIAFLGMSGL